MSGIGTPEWYTTGYRPRPPRGRISTSETEIVHAGLAFAVLTLAFSIVRADLAHPHQSFIAVGPAFIVAWIPFGAVAAFTAFLLHEMGHKVAAQRHGFWAEFRMSPMGLLFCLVVVLVSGFIFAAPGATVVGGMGDQREWGRTSLAGPLTNLAEGGIFLAALAALPFVHLASWAFSLEVLVFLNAWFAVFNLIPFGPLDGAKIWRWSKGIWVSVFVVSAIFAGLFYAVTFLQLS